MDIGFSARRTLLILILSAVGAFWLGYGLTIQFGEAISIIDFSIHADLLSLNSVGLQVSSRPQIGRALNNHLYQISLSQAFGVWVWGK